jgi:hypothetical protein
MVEKSRVEALRRAGSAVAEKLRSLVEPRPRPALALATALLSLVLVQSVLAVAGVGARVDESSAASLFTMIERQANLAHAGAVRLVNDFRLVYEVHSQLQEGSALGSSAPTQPCSLASRLGLP